MLSKCAICDSKKITFIEEEEGKSLLSNLGITTPLRIIPIFGDIFFKKNANSLNAIEKRLKNNV